MGLRIRTLLMWLLMLAVSVQGASAATMAFCGPSHHGIGHASQAEEGVILEHEHQGDRAHGDHHHAVEQGVDVSPSAMATPHAKFVHADKHKCSACASCCAVVALPSATFELEPPLLADQFLPLAPRSVTSVLPKGLERPPRSSLV